MVSKMVINCMFILIVYISLQMQNLFLHMLNSPYRIYVHKFTCKRCSGIFTCIFGPLIYFEAIHIVHNIMKFCVLCILHRIVNQLQMVFYDRKVCLHYHMIIRPCLGIYSQCVIFHEFNHHPIIHTDENDENC